MRSKVILAIGFMIPILALLMLVLNNQYMLSTGREVQLPITGYDPRDLISGHYILYKINYGVDNICGDAKGYGTSEKDAYVCLDTKKVSNLKPKDCEIFISGSCRYGEFRAGIEQFYASEQDALELQKILQNTPGEIVLSVTKNGHAMVKSMLLNGKRWEGH